VVSPVETPIAPPAAPALASSGSATEQALAAARGSAPATAPRPRPAPQPAQVATANSTPAPASDPNFLPLPELRRTAPEAPQQVAATPAEGSGDSATLEERMLAGSMQADAPVANSYASASTEDAGLTGMVLRLVKKKPGEENGDGTN
jgi:hypothetical protein